MPLPLHAKPPSGSSARECAAPAGMRSLRGSFGSRSNREQADESQILRQPTRRARRLILLLATKPAARKE